MPSIKQQLDCSLHCLAKYGLFESTLSGFASLYSMEPLSILTEQLTLLGTGAIALLPQLGIALVVLLVTWIIGTAIGVLSVGSSQRSIAARPVAVKLKATPPFGPSLLRLRSIRPSRSSRRING